jgi:diguanylate cyclase (GGDEF)-like protein
VRHIDEFITYTIDRGRVRVARFRFSLAGEKESPAEPSRLLAEVGRLRPDLITLVGTPDDAAKLVEEISRNAREETVLLLVPMPKQAAAQPAARVGLIVPDASQTRDLEPVIRSLLYSLCLNPKTQMLSNQAMEAFVEKRIRAKQQFGFFYLDIDRFKEYNNTYGFTAGDAAIQMLAGVISSAMRDHGAHDDLAAHIGGDDFAVLSAPDRALGLAEAIRTTFKAKAPSLYSTQEQAQGHTMVDDREAREKVRRPFMTVSIGLLTTATRWVTSYRELSDRVTELKEAAKQKKPGEPVGGDRIQEERRRDGT